MVMMLGLGLVKAAFEHLASRVRSLGDTYGEIDARTREAVGLAPRPDVPALPAPEAAQKPEALPRANGRGARVAAR